MSRERIRPTREETRLRLFAAAAVVFARTGVGAATVEDIASEAGYSRGAFYSNFATKEELALGMLEDHLAQSQARNRDLLARHPDATGFVQALQHEADRHDPLHTNPLLQVELMLYVARTPELRGKLGEHIGVMRSLVGEIALSAMQATGLELDVDAEQLGTILVALEDGLRLHQIIDPSSTGPDAFFESLATLQRLLVNPASGRSRKTPAS